MNSKNQIRYAGNFGNDSNDKKAIIISLCFIVAIIGGFSVKYFKDTSVSANTEITTNS